MQISKSWSQLSDKMHLKRVISKKLLFSSNNGKKSKNLLFFGNISFQVHFVTKLRPHFWNLRKITDFLISIKSYFERKKFQTLLSGFGQKKFHKNKARAETTQNIEKRLFYFSLRFPTRIHFQVSKMQIPKSLHPTEQYGNIEKTMHRHYLVHHQKYNLIV